VRSSDSAFARHFELDYYVSIHWACVFYCLLFCLPHIHTLLLLFITSSAVIAAFWHNKRAVTPAAFWPKLELAVT
jgi:hypothetical protein